ncbi:hypothetical protein QQY24_18410 [Streptomyces sp. TG1A-8]|uniref:hypothetical protein n=1 Tax=Streptomyces sp. TG1A-8 TaxID=3051385 RepID=UPI00265C68B8|nr:hypothetical protein [Streptomyces sp. TG1A-8]MDO0927290.1 hypothetical protein [Streptomyces sp. TG1A-8]
MPAPKPLRYKGRPVPYISVWSSERIELPKLTVVSGALALRGERRAAGVLWKPWRARLGVGEPALGDVHGPRQRECMLRKLCQVCGCQVVRDELGWPWLLEDDRGQDGWPEREVTTHPPTCETCQPVAQVQCDPNRGRFASVRVGRVVTDGVYGQMYRPGARPMPVGRERVVFAGDPGLRWMLGGQIAATLLDVTVVDMRTQAPVSQETVRG